MAENRNPQHSTRQQERIQRSALQAAEHFISRHEAVTAVEPLGSGIIHDTFLVHLMSGADRFILQRINTGIFVDPTAMMHNLYLVCRHIRQQLQKKGSRQEADWQIPHPVPTRDGGHLYYDADGGCWRALTCIKDAVPLARITSLDDAGEAGRALGTFHRLISNLNPNALHDILPGFHDIEQYLAQYDAVLDNNKMAGAKVKFCRQFIAARRSWAPVLENGRRKNLLSVRVIHGDPKIDNIMVHHTTGKAVSIIDLDTVMPGLVPYDIGDCLRSSCNDSGEEAVELSAVRFDLARCEAVLSRYAEAAGGSLSQRDFDFLFDAARLIPFELGLRFFTDFLQGNVYFKVGRQDQNLDRAMVQFRLVASIEEQEEMIREIIEACRSTYLDGAYSK